MEIHELNEDGVEQALDLAWEVFLQFEAPDYTKQGVDEFFKSIHDAEWIRTLRMFGAFMQGEMLGMIATRNYGSHIALFFVQAPYQKQGIGRKLFTYILQENHTGTLTVNASPFAVPVYHRLGFQEVHPEKELNGIKFTPMKIVF